jgi:voltage-gated potassium channel
MSEIDPRPGPGAGDDPAVDDPGRRLAAYEARTRTPLDLLALVTLWVVVVPPGDFSTAHYVSTIVLAIQLAIRLVYALDIGTRSVLSGQPVRYLIAHPVGIAAVLLPPVRVAFSLRLARSMFRRGSLERFLLTAIVLVLNGALIVWLVERHAPHSNIHTLGDAVWWSFVTVTTVGYGDFYPVTTAGRVTACFIMAIGLVTLAVITAQVASSFVAQGVARSRNGLQPAPAAPEPAAPGAAAAAPEVTLAEIDRRLARLEELITAAAAPPRAAGPPDWEPGGG